MIEYRKKLLKQDIHTKKGDRDERVAELQKVQFKDYYKPNDYVSNPKYTSLTQIKDEDARLKRQRGSLLSQSNEINGDKLIDPSMKWVQDAYKPNFKEL